MRKVILQEFVTLDGLAAGPNDSTDFVPSSTRGDHSLGQEQLRLMDSIDTILLGRVTYQMFSQYWPKVTSGEDKVFADKLNAIPKVVFSETLDRAPWGDWNNAKVIRKDAAEEVAKLKQQSGKDMIMWGSISTAQSLMDEQLVDEYRLMVCPVVLGKGRSLFREKVDTGEMKLLEVKTFDRGAVQLRYRSEKARSAETAGQRTTRSALV
jgi:dihydrofolate reductase